MKCDASEEISDGTMEQYIRMVQLLLLLETRDSVTCQTSETCPLLFPRSLEAFVLTL